VDAPDHGQDRRAITTAGHPVGARTVARLLDKLHFSLRVNCKKIAAEPLVTRPTVRHITRLRRRFCRHGNPIISVDAKKRELVGNFKNPGRKWEHVPPRSTTTTFAPLPRASPSLRHLRSQANCGSVFVGVSHETSAFAVTSISRWWGREGRARYPDARHLLILADTGGSNSATRGAWKDQLQQHLCDRLGLTVTVAHYPTGASKYNPIERRLFSQISRNWAAEPLTDYDKILRLIRGPPPHGLKVRAYLDTREYPLKVKPSAQRLRQLRITRHTTLPKWNYTITPSNGK